jgi:hypothetical protein
MSLPISLTGLQVTISEADCKFSFSPSEETDNSNILDSDESYKDCEMIDLTDQDLFDFHTSGSFLKTYLLALSNSLPNWIEFYASDESSLRIDNVKSDIVYGDEIKDNEWCAGVPVQDKHLYNVFRLDTSFRLRIFSQYIELGQPLKDSQFCFITDLSTNAAGSFYLMVPEDSRSFLESVGVFQELRETYGLKILPRGIGLSVVNKGQPTELELWNGDTMFETSYVCYLIC